MMAERRKQKKRISDRATDHSRRLLVGPRLPRELAEEYRKAAQEKNQSLYQWAADALRAHYLAQKKARSHDGGRGPGAHSGAPPRPLPRSGASAVCALNSPAGPAGPGGCAPVAGGRAAPRRPRCGAGPLRGGLGGPRGRPARVCGLRPSPLPGFVPPRAHFSPLRFPSARPAAARRLRPRSSRPGGGWAAAGRPL